MNIMKVGPLALVDISTEASARVEKTNVDVSSIEQHADAPQDEGSCCSALFKAIADLFNSIIVFFKNLCSASQEKIIYEKTEIAPGVFRIRAKRNLQ